MRSGPTVTRADDRDIRLHLIQLCRDGLHYSISADRATGSSLTLLLLSSALAAYCGWLAAKGRLGTRDACRQFLLRRRIGHCAVGRAAGTRSAALCRRLAPAPGQPGPPRGAGPPR